MMINLESAEKILNEVSRTVSDTEMVKIINSTGRVIAEDIFSDVDMPPFDKSAMDGYACRITDISQPLEVIETIAAGTQPVNIISNGECAKIMTGAKVPTGADCVIMKEDTTQIGPNQIRFTGNKTQKNICLHGEDVKKRDKVLSKGAVINSQTLAILAATGHTVLKVMKQLEVGFFCTGSELVEPEVTPEGVSIRNSNASQLWGQIAGTGSIPHYGGIITDTKPAISGKTEEMLKLYRMVIITGGASVGDFDFVPEILKASGFTIHFQKVGIQPGKPVLFATRDNRYVFGLSGNPVSSFLQFELLVKPLIFKLYGSTIAFRNIAMIAGENLTRKKTDRKLFIPVIIGDDGMVLQKAFHGSAHIAALQDIFGFAIIPEGVHEIKKGAVVYVRPI